MLSELTFLLGFSLSNAKDIFVSVLSVLETNHLLANTIWRLMFPAVLWQKGRKKLCQAVSAGRWDNDEYFISLAILKSISLIWGVK